MMTIDIDALPFLPSTKPCYAAALVTMKLKDVVPTQHKTLCLGRWSKSGPAGDHTTHTHHHTGTSRCWVYLFPLL